MDAQLTHVLDDVAAGARLETADAVRLLESHDLASIGRAAHAVTQRLHPEPYRTYNIDRNINYTNICTAVCDFCAFYRGPKHPEGYVLDREVLLKKIEETVAIGGDQILMQGGLHPTLTLEWYEDLLRDIKSHFPEINVHGFSPPEIYHLTKVAKRPLQEVLERLAAAGLGSLPGGGGEILVDRVRQAMTRGKVLTDDWLEVHRQWHALGGKSTATMMTLAINRVCHHWSTSWATANVTKTAANVSFTTRTNVRAVTCPATSVAILRSAAGFLTSSASSRMSLRESTERAPSMAVRRPPKITKMMAVVINSAVTPSPAHFGIAQAENLADQTFPALPQAPRGRSPKDARGREW
jgi:CofH subfamily radical SAM domain protein